VAVYTDVPEEALVAFVEGYDIGEVLSFKGIAEGVENTNYFLHTSVGNYILTLYEKRVAREDLPFFLGLMEHLAGRGISCPLPVRDRRGEKLNALAGRPAAIATFLDGLSIRRPTPKRCGALGEALARLHEAGRDFPLRRENALSLPAWRPLFAQADGQADSVSPGLAERTRAELDHLEGAWPRGLPEGVIHADLFVDNVFFIGEDVSGLIDFYFACNDVLAYDLAICLNAWCFEPDGSYNVTKSRALIAGYERVRRLEPAEVAALPTLCRGAALRFMLTRLVDWLNVPPGALVKPKDPLEYARKLASHRRAETAAAYGLDR
jgi:homoserine kinase type II